MKKIMRPKYYCDFCNKGGGSGGHIKKHESRCTKNPARECGMCKLLEQTQPDLKALMALLPSAEEQKYTDYIEFGGSIEQWRDVPPETVKALCAAAGDCPACIMAALRQRGLPVPTAQGFNFSEGCKRVWSEYNERTMEEEHAYGY